MQNSSKSVIHNVVQSNKQIVAVFVKIKVLPSKVGFFKEEIAKVVPLTLQEEGAYCYILHESKENETEFALYEQWASEEHLQAHLKTQHMNQFLMRLKILWSQVFQKLKHM